MLVGGFNPSENMLASWDYYFQYGKSVKIPWFQTTNQKLVAADAQVVFSTAQQQGSSDHPTQEGSHA